MTDGVYELSAQQLLEAQQALDVAAFNGILSLAIILRKRALLTDAETEGLHDIMSKPLSSMPSRILTSCSRCSWSAAERAGAAIRHHRRSNRICGGEKIGIVPLLPPFRMTHSLHFGAKGA